MCKMTKYHIVGYSLMIAGIISAVANYFISFDSDPRHQFGNFFVFIFSGMVFAAGLTLVFNNKEVKSCSDLEKDTNQSSQ